MSLQAPLQHELDLDRHAGEHAPDQPVPKPQLGSEVDLDPAVIEGTISLRMQLFAQLLKMISTPRSWYKSHRCAQVWNVTLGPDSSY